MEKMGFFQIIMLIDVGLTILGKLFPLVRQAEETHGPGKGLEKQTDVLNEVAESVDTVTETMIEDSSGGQKETWEKVKAARNPIMSILGTVISFIAGGLFPKGATTANWENDED